MKLRTWFWVVAVIAIIVFAILSYRGYQVNEGRRVFERSACASCHMAGGAPSLAHEGSKRNRDMLLSFVSNPDAYYAAHGSHVMNAGYPQMPRQPLTHREVVALSYFLSAQD